MITPNKSWGHGSVSPCMIDNVWTKCGAEYQKIWAPMTAKVAAMEKMAAALTTDEAKKAFWAKAKADPKNIAEWGAMEKKASELFMEDKKTWQSTFAASDEKE